MSEHIECVIPEPDLFIVSKASEGLWADGKPVPDSFKAKAGENEYWFARIPSIMDFVKEYGRCIVEADWSGFNKIQIYDDYVE